MITHSPLRLIASAAFLIAAITFSADAQSRAPRILVFSKTAGFPHSSIPNGIAAIRKLGQENGFAVDATEDAGAFTQKNLARYSAEGCTPRCEHTSQVVRQEEVCACLKNRRERAGEAGHDVFALQRLFGGDDCLGAVGAIHTGQAALGI